MNVIHDKKCERLTTPASEWTLDLLEKYGWRFVPSHDVKGPAGFSDVAVPECWVHDDYQTLYYLDDVLNFITKQAAQADEENSK